MAIDKDLVKKTIKEAAIQSRKKIDMIEKSIGREDLYRFLFQYPKKWSRRKVKKIGSRDIEHIRLEFGINEVVKAVTALGKDYENIFSEDV
jgi:hypothetical protein